MALEDGGALRHCLLGFGLAALGACAGPPADECGAAKDAFRIPVHIVTEEGAVRIQAEVADDESERARGLMFRECLREREGMLFLFPQPRQQSFWMKNTLIPLDMIFIREDRTVLGIVAEAEPQTLTSRRVPGASQYVLELAGGEAARLGIESGQRVDFMAPVPER
ncbi:MAG: DUF192 domain-containing protein [Myxococcota bacterium]